MRERKGEGEEGDGFLPALVLLLYSLDKGGCRSLIEVEHREGWGPGLCVEAPSFSSVKA